MGPRVLVSRTLRVRLRPGRRQIVWLGAAAQPRCAQPVRDRPRRTDRASNDQLQRALTGRVHGARQGSRSGQRRCGTAVSGLGARDQLIQLYCAAVAGANVESLTTNAVATLPVDRRHRVWLFAFGKAAHVMAHAAVTALQRLLGEVAGGIVVAPEPGEAPNGTIAAVVGDHPIPRRRSFDAAQPLSQALSEKRPGDIGLLPLSGGT